MNPSLSSASVATVLADYSVHISHVGRSFAQRRFFIVYGAGALLEEDFIERCLCWQVRQRRRSQLHHP